MIQMDKLAQKITAACLEENASDVVVLDVHELTIIADYFIIASGRNVLQVKSIVENVEETLMNCDIKPLRRDGNQAGFWVVLDYGAVILHVFREEEREYYNLENLWADAREVELNYAE